MQEEQQYQEQQFEEEEEELENGEEGEELEEEDEDEAYLVDLDPIQLKELIDNEDGVVYNLEVSLKEEQQDMMQNSELLQDKQQNRDILAYQIKRQMFLVKGHETAKSIAQKGINLMKEQFETCLDFVEQEINQSQQNIEKSQIKKNEDQDNNNNNLNQNERKNEDLGEVLQETQFTKKIITEKRNVTDQNTNQEVLTQQINEQVQFYKVILNKAWDSLQKVVDISEHQDFSKASNQYNEASKSLYFWKNNPENNERHLRYELKAKTKKNEENEDRSILGIQNGTEWIEVFNIGTIMHMSPINYEEFTFFGDIYYELSQKMLLEKIIYFSVCYFTVATEIRFQELDKIKKNEAKEQEKLQCNKQNQETKPIEEVLKEKQQAALKKQQQQQNTQIETDAYKISETYHIKAVEIVCKFITCKSPYINHLVTSYHKHYNQNLGVIREEESVFSCQNSPNVKIVNSQSKKEKISSFGKEDFSDLYEQGDKNDFNQIYFDNEQQTIDKNKDNQKNNNDQNKQDIKQPQFENEEILVAISSQKESNNKKSQQNDKQTNKQIINKKTNVKKKVKKIQGQGKIKKEVKKIKNITGNQFSNQQQNNKFGQGQQNNDLKNNYISEANQEKQARENNWKSFQEFKKQHRQQIISPNVKEKQLVAIYKSQRY
ncbi:hypothetical protein PPERSA_04997 [Pseudocohnilembus persalinus]|uniref:Uncharacterized protein n=1 Tax=Pseudocohnilembus persalinus TaxID=266149 RepID=A0A0V0QWK3_PSEPJ|nr:hypothetical protein PPERSA_04997 [Pseudocohnilembus persalinus]|eukprot:KRX06384.1 hypothetical protein PPERSA_04997 [Pseudocohnilembus persalinus]